MDGNATKNVSYTWAFARMKEAHGAGYHLEATALAESIISDRLLSYLRSQGSKTTVDHATVVKLGIEFERHASKLGNDDFGKLASEIVAWGKHRNAVLHSVAKSEPGTPTVPIAAFMKTAKATSDAGHRLARKVSNWHRAQLRHDKRQGHGA
jgi:hypothetical protein